MNEMTESEYLQMWQEEDWEEDDDEETSSERLAVVTAKIGARLTLHSKNQSAKVNTIIKCPCGCGRTFKKRSYQHSFFSYKGRGSFASSN